MAQWRLDMSIWKTLSALDCNAHVDKKGQFSYLSWTWAWAMVKENFPDATYKIEDDIIYPDGTMEVRCTVTIEGLAHTMWLPVLDFKNRAISSPNAFDVNSSRMRCLVKCLAMFGLGHYIYAGESVPQNEPFTAEQKATFTMLLASNAGWELKAFAREVGVEVLTNLFNSFPKGEITKSKQLYRDVVGKANDDLKATIEAIQIAIQDDSISAIEEILDERDDNQRLFIFEGLSDIEKQQIQQMRDGV
jgi:hypothetical protein